MPLCIDRRSRRYGGGKQRPKRPCPPYVPLGLTSGWPPVVRVGRQPHQTHPDHRYVALRGAQQSPSRAQPAASRSPNSGCSTGARQPLRIAGYALPSMAGGLGDLCEFERGKTTEGETHEQLAACVDVPRAPPQEGSSLPEALGDRMRDDHAHPGILSKQPHRPEREGSLRRHQGHRALLAARRPHVLRPYRGRPGRWCRAAVGRETDGLLHAESVSQRWPRIEGVCPPPEARGHTPAHANRVRPALELTTSRRSPQPPPSR